MIGLLSYFKKLYLVTIYN